MRKQKRRGLLFGIVSIGLALATGFLFSSRIEALEQQVGEMQRVVVAKGTIAPRTLITTDMLEVREIPRRFAHPAYIQSVADVAEQRVAVIEIAEGSILRESDVAPTSGLEDDTRAISIGANPISVQVDRVVPGSRVDVIVSYETVFLDSQGQEVRTRRTVTLLHDIEVLAVAGAPQVRSTTQTDSSQQDSQQSSSIGGIFGASRDVPQATSNPFSSPYGLRNSVVVVTLKATPQDAQKLAYADTFASDIRLSLRRSDDRSIEPLPPISEEDFR
jgi:Flp pilus assembly protein CpaB